MFRNIFQILDFSYNYEWQLKFEVKKLFSLVFPMMLNMSEHGDLLISFVLESYVSLFMF